MMLTVMVPMSRKSRDMGHPRLGSASTKENGLRDPGHPALTRIPVVQIAMLVIGQRVCGEQSPIPAATRPDVAHSDQRLGFGGHGHANRITAIEGLGGFRKDGALPKS